MVSNIGVLGRKVLHSCVYSPFVCRKYGISLCCSCICLFLVTWITSITSCMFPYAWPVSNICWAYVDVSLLCLIALTCSLYRIPKDRPVWPMYSKGHPLHLSLYTPLWSYGLLLCCFGLTCFCMLFVVRYATFKSVSLNTLATFVISCPNYIIIF
jgi:hypothetical protein